jgi:hypothetical protein
MFADTATWFFLKTVFQRIYVKIFNILKPNGYIVYHQVNVKIFYNLSGECIYAFWKDFGNTIVLLYNINWLVLRTTRCVFTARYELDIYIYIYIRNSSKSKKNKPGRDKKKCHWNKFFAQYFGLAPSILFHHRSILILICMLLLKELQTGEAWEPSKKQCCLGNLGPWNGKLISLIL